MSVFVMRWCRPLGKKSRERSSREQEIGFTIVPCSFADLVEDMCTCVQFALTTLTGRHSSKCQERIEHDQDANRTVTLESSVSEENAAEVRATLLGTAYEWMLNLEATDWPKDVAPPVPVPTWRQHHLLN
eukprot:Skav222956  [mRNA]  locus=scaffold1489:730232:730621:- [translate_table: standard]